MRVRYVALIVAVCAALLGAILATLARREIPETQATPTPVIPTSLTVQPIAQKVTVTLTTNKGKIRLELDGTRAPLTVGNFVALAEKGFYDGTTFHRVIPDFMIQGGDPFSKHASQRARHGTGGPGYTFPDEINGMPIVRGTVAMANAGPNTNGSQFFIVTAAATPHLDTKHTNFGKVISGMDIVDVISQVERDENDIPLRPVVIDALTVEASPSIPPLAAWKTYESMEYGFEIRYPPHMDVAEEFVIDSPRVVIRGYRPIQTKDGFSAGDELIICPEGCGYFGVGTPTVLEQAPVTTAAGLPAKVLSGGTEDDSLTVSFIRTPTSRFLPFSDAQKNFGSIQTHRGPGNHRAALTEQMLETFRFLN